ncbi:MAG: putative metal-dependent hydrolase YcfH [candidate division WS2 bacterium]|nr:putative metal-dependent hydrolase YcfH [Candidatus Lithacetigena glycinireducens]MBT9174433.1 putative metal-dependent hydrolase YcfH [Candidatus Lithacetigena glycinireducens]
MIKLIDSHTHLNSHKLLPHLDDVIRESNKIGLISMLNVGYDFSTSLKGIEIASKYQNIYTSVGLHPNDIKGFNVKTLEDYKRLLEKPRVIAIGEVGLDYFRNPEHKNDQKKVMEFFIDLALQAQLPLILHIRDAYNECYDMLNSFNELPRIIFHCFSGNKNDAKLALDYDSCISFAGNITYPKANLLRDTLSSIPLNRILLETDAPYLPPQSFRGKICQPSFILETYSTVAKLRKVSLESLSQTILDSYNKLFRGVA